MPQPLSIQSTSDKSLISRKPGGVETLSEHAQCYLLSVRAAADYLGRSEKAVRHLYEKRILTALRIDGRVFIDRREIDALYEKARLEAS